MSLWHTERELKTAGRKDLAKIVAGVREAFGQDIPLPTVPSAEKSPRAQSVSTETLKPVELDLEAEWQRQTAKYIEFGYHTELGLTEEDYLASLPKFEPQPKEYKGKFDKPLIVEKRIPWEKQAELAGISLSDYLTSRINETRMWEGNRSKAPDRPYAGWFNNWGQRFPDKIRPDDARSDLKNDEYGGDPFEGVAQQVHHPEDNINGKYFDLIGFAVGSSGYVVDLGRWDGRPGLRARWGGDARSDFRPLVRGSKIVTG